MAKPRTQTFVFTLKVNTHTINQFYYPDVLWAFITYATKHKLFKLLDFVHEESPTVRLHIHATIQATKRNLLKICRKNIGYHYNYSPLRSQAAWDQYRRKQNLLEIPKPIDHSVDLEGLKHHEALIAIMKHYSTLSQTFLQNLNPKEGNEAILEEQKDEVTPVLFSHPQT